MNYMVPEATSSKKLLGFPKYLGTKSLVRAPQGSFLEEA